MQVIVLCLQHENSRFEILAATSISKKIQV